MVGRFNLKNALGGLVSSGVPFIFKGMINGWLTEKHITVPTACQWVIQNRDLLTLFVEYGGENFENALDRAGAYVKDPSWLTSDWLIDAVRDEHPDIASLFLGWEEGRVWLDIQTEKLRDAFNQQVNHIAPVAIENPPDPTEEEEPAPARSQASNYGIKGSENFGSIEVRNTRLI